MIHVIGTAHNLQVWTDARRACASAAAELHAFEAYLAEAAERSGAEVIGEESGAVFVASYVGGASVALGVAERLGIEHVFCDPDPSERRDLGLLVGHELDVHAMTIAQQTGEDWRDVHDREVSGQFPAREAFWIKRLQHHGCAERTAVFVCGADHTESFAASLEAAGIGALIYCRDWTEL